MGTPFLILTRMGIMARARKLLIARWSRLGGRAYNPATSPNVTLVDRVPIPGALRSYPDAHRHLPHEDAHPEGSD